MSILFIHGAGCTAEVFEQQLRAFADASAPNLPGHLCAGSPASIEEFASAVDQDVIERGLREVVLCGHSMGGAVALELALRKPSWLRAVVAIGSGLRMRVAPSFLEGLEKDFEDTARTIAGYFFSDPTPERVEQAVDRMRAVGAEQTLRDFRACNAFDATASVNDLDVPLLALTGELDQLMPATFAQALADRVPGAESRIVPGAGHFVMAERPTETNRAIRAFVAGLP